MGLKFVRTMDKAEALTCCVELYLSSLAFSHSGSGFFLTQPKGYS